MKELKPKIRIVDNEVSDMSLDSIDNFFSNVRFNFKINKPDKLIKQIDLSRKLKQSNTLF